MSRARLLLKSYLLEYFSTKPLAESADEYDWRDWMMSLEALWNARANAWSLQFSQPNGLSIMALTKPLPVQGE